MTFATRATRIERPVYRAGTADRVLYHAHKGFNWRAFRAELASRFLIHATHFSPFPLSHGWLSSQTRFLCRKR